MPSSGSFAVRPAASVDLATIWADGAAAWGLDQADRYADGLFMLFELLATFPEMARERTEFRPPVRVHPSGAHIVLYRMEGKGIEIIRVLHARQDLTAFLLEG